MKKIGIGYENYKEFVDQKLYYVDKTLFIRDIVEKGGKVTLFTRPRRFGKTLALSMLRTFFEAELDREGNPVDNRRYFEGMKIMGCGEEILSKQGQYPVINLTLKSAKQQRFGSAVLRLREEIVSEFERHAYVLDSDRLSEDLKKDFRSFRSANSIWREKEGQLRSKEETEEALLVEAGRFSTSLKTLSECLKLYHGKNVVMLIDEYDVPLENAYFEGFYQEMSGFIRSLFESAVKTNDSLELAVITAENTEGMKTYVTGLLKRCISTFDSEEAFYHGFLLSVLSEFPDYSVRSNREEGDGRPDIVLYPLEPEDPAYIFEIKVRKKFNEMRDGIEEAFRQIRDRRYEEGILDDGYAGVISFGVCFCRKACIMERKKY